MAGPASPKEMPPLATEALVELRRVVDAEVFRAVRTLAHLHRRGVLTDAQYRRLLSQLETECHLIVAHATWEPGIRTRPAPAPRLSPLGVRPEPRVPVLSGRE